jgi:hypothetical protein
MGIFPMQNQYLVLSYMWCNILKGLEVVKQGVISEGMGQIFACGMILRFCMVTLGDHEQDKETK